MSDELPTVFDAPTGTLSRGGFLYMSEHVCRLAQRYDWHVGLIVADVDALGERNRSAGRTAGDEAVRAVAAVLASCFRSSDLVGRTGDDELAVLLPDVRLGIVLSIADHARGKVEGLAAAGGPLTISMGVACEPVTADSTRSLEALFGIARAGLARAKESGRNRIVAG